MGSSIPYVTQQDKLLLNSYETVAASYARSINKNSAEWNGKDMRGFLDFLWKTRAARTHAPQPKRWTRTCDAPDAKRTTKGKK